MKKKIISFAFLILCLFPTFIYASEKIKISKNGKYSSVGQVYTSSRLKTEDKYAEGVVSFGPVSVSTYEGFLKNSNLKVTSKISKFYCGNYNGSSTYFYGKKTCENNCKDRKDSYFCSEKVYGKYQIVSEKGKVTTTYKNQDISGNQYQTSDGLDAYCITPGRRFQNNGNWCINDEFDVSDCSNSNDSYECGLAWILLQNVDESGASLGTYSYGAMLTAVRLWTAYHSNFSGMDDFGVEDDGIDYILEGNFYSITAHRASGGYTGGACSSDKSSAGIICGEGDYQTAIQLFQQAFNGQEITMPGAGKEAKLETEIIRKDTTEVVVEIPFDLSDPRWAGYEDKIKIRLIGYKNGKEVEIGSNDQQYCEKNYCTFKIEPLCEMQESQKITVEKVRITIEDYSANGMVRQYMHCSSPEKYQIMMVAGTPEGLDTDFESSTESNTSTSESENTYVSEPKVTVICTEDCNDGNKCPGEEFISTSDSGKECVGYETYDYGYKKDPYMNCILNACVVSDKQRFDESSEFGVNTNVCRIFCREEMEFFLANKTDVYAGMQFKYDLRDKGLVTKNEKFSGIAINSFSVDQKISAVVLQARQCTSEIYYDRKPNEVYSLNTGTQSWLEQYKEATENMIKAWDEWKKWETLLLWQNEENGGKADKHKSDAATCYQGTGCGGTCNYLKTLPEKDPIFHWPKKGSTKPFTKSELKSTTFPKEGGVKFTVPESGTTASHISGEYNIATSCSRSCCELGEDCDNGCCKWAEENGTCTEGSTGNEGEVAAKEATAEQAYLNTIQIVKQLIYDLQNCNMYSGSEIVLPNYEHFSRVSAGGENVKEKMLSEASENVMELYVEYADKTYGEKIKYDSSVKDGKAEAMGDVGIQTTYCKNGNDSNPNCYNYVPQTEVEAKEGNDTKEHDIVPCKEEKTKAECYIEKMQLPTNDYARFINISKTDYWRPKQYQVSVYTGKVTEGQGNGESTVPLDSNLYPVSMDKISGATGTYDIDWQFKKVGENAFTRINEYLYSCTYDVYNTTTLYDCEYYDENGNIDWEKCENSCFAVDGNVPDICIDNEFNNDKKGYGFIYRNVDLNDLFPTDRKIGTNWSNATEVIAQIQNTADEIWSDEYLEYSFTLEPEDINKIRNYNDNKNGTGGYLDNSLYSCYGDSELGFSNCKSSFLLTHNLREGLGVEINKMPIGVDY